MEAMMSFDRDTARSAKEEGMSQAELGANPAWSAEMLEHVVATARAVLYFTSDDVFRRAYTAGLTARTRDQRAFGPVMVRAAKAGVCRKANLAPVNSDRRTLHASPRTVWQSLLYRAD
jgi:hypothetical protein